MIDKEKKFSNIKQIIDAYLPNYQEIRKTNNIQLGRTFGDQLANDLLENFREDLKKVKQQPKQS